MSIGFVVGLEYADVELSAHDILQEFKTHRLVRKILGGGERVAWGAKTITEGGLLSLPSKLNAPGLLLVGEGAGLVNVPRLKGVHYAIESGRLAAEAAFAALQRGEVAHRRGALDGYDASLRASYVWKELAEVRNMRQVFDKGFFMGGALASAMTVTKGKLPPKDFDTHPNADAPLIRTGRAAQLPGARRDADLRQAVVRLRVGEPDARRPAEPRARPDEGPARSRGDVAVDVPRARLRGGRRRRRRHGRGEGHALELRAVRRDQREGRTADAARGRLRPRVHRDLSYSACRAAHASAIATRCASVGCVWRRTYAQVAGLGSPSDVSENSRKSPRAESGSRVV